MAKYPISLELTGRRVVIIGGGEVAARKLQTILDAGAAATVLSANISDHIKEVAKNGNVELIQAQYYRDALTGATLAIAATDDRRTNEMVFEHCRELGILCNVVDVPELCDFFVPAVIKRGSLEISISTQGKCPAYAGRIRAMLEEIFTEQHGEFLDALEDLRRCLIANVSDCATRGQILKDLAGAESFSYYKEKGPDAWRIRAENIIRKAV